MGAVLLVIPCIVALAPPDGQVAAGPAGARGGDAPVDAIAEPGAPIVPASRIDVAGGVSFVSQYIARGVAFAAAPSVQPYVELRVALPRSERDGITDVQLVLGSWNSIQGGDPGLGQANDGAVPGWYEADLYAGVAIELHERWTIAGTAYRYISPAGSFPGYTDLSLTVSYDDTALWAGMAGLRDFKLAPSIRVMREVGQPNRRDAIYVQPSLGVGFGIGKAVAVTVPVAAGFSDSFYDGVRGGKRRFGFFRTGAAVSAEAFEGVTVTGGVDLWFMNGRVDNGLNDREVVARVGAGWGF